MMSSPGPEVPPHARWRDWLATVLLCGYVLVPAAFFFSAGPAQEPALPRTVLGVLSLAAWELVLFTLIFGAACRLARLGGCELRWRWAGNWRAVPRAFLWSLLLRLVLAVFLMLVHGLISLVAPGQASALAQGQPGIHAIADPQALKDPLYLIVQLTLVSFVLAGMREELWRAALLTLLPRLFPRRLGGSRGPWLAVVPIAVVFAVGHVSQGVFGLYSTLLLGVGLGALLLWRNAVSDAVLVHGFFNAGTFAAVALLADHLPPPAP